MDQYDLTAVLPRADSAAASAAIPVAVVSRPAWSATKSPLTTTRFAVAMSARSAVAVSGDGHGVRRVGAARAVPGRAGRILGPLQKNQLAMGAAGSSRTPRRRPGRRSGPPHPARPRLGEVSSTPTGQPFRQVADGPRRF